MNRKNVILNRDMLVVSFSIVDCIKEKLNFLINLDISLLVLFEYF